MIGYGGMVENYERHKDALQEVAESTAAHVGKIAVIIAEAVQQVTREIGDLITDSFEVVEASRKAKQDQDR
ncbi:MAG: hypothetical protein ACRCSF_06740 [Mycobacteriaceae bacterium]